MLDWLDRQRQKPKEARVRVAFVVAIVVTAIVGLFWIVSLPVRMSTLGESLQNNEDSSPNNSFQELDEALGERRNMIEETIKEVRTAPDPEGTTTFPTTGGFPSTTPTTTASSTLNEEQI